jgi:hypothetical protein
MTVKILLVMTAIGMGGEPAMWTPGPKVKSAL